MKDHGHEIEKILQREATLLGQDVELDEFRSITTQHGRTWLVVYEQPWTWHGAIRMRSTRFCVYQQVGEDLKNLFSGIIASESRKDIV